MCDKMFFKESTHDGVVASRGYATENKKAYPVSPTG